MKYLAIILLWMPLSLFSQAKWDYNWILGYDTDLAVPGGEGIHMNFNNGEVAIGFFQKDMNMFTDNGTISDGWGNLLFYTNGCYIATRDHETMLNGNGLNPGDVHDNYCDFGYPAVQGVLMLPSVVDTNQYFLIHNGGSNESFFHSDVLYYTLVDMTLDGGLGGVVEKNVPIIEDSLWTGHLTATKHANNRDWWIISAKGFSDVYYKLLLDSSGISVVGEQAIGLPLEYASSITQSVFSPDGSSYAWYDQLRNVQLFDFDRATGELSNFRQIFVADTAYFGGVAFSPNSRFLYVSNALYLYQFDLLTSDIQSSKILVDTFDGFASPFNTHFHLMQLGPDCRIYVSTRNGTDRLHVIQYPDQKGENCGFQQHAIKLPKYNTSTIPNFPNYRLGTPYPVCDSSIALVTTAVRVPPPLREARLWPNPASGEVHLALPAALAQPGTWALYNGMGQRVRREVLSTGQSEYSFSVAGLPPGLYFWEVKSSNRRLGGGKLVVQP